MPRGKEVVGLAKGVSLSSVVKQKQTKRRKKVGRTCFVVGTFHV